MLANLVGIVGGPAEVRRSRVELAAAEMPRGGAAGSVHILESSEACFGWTCIVRHEAEGRFEVAAVVNTNGVMVMLDGRLDDVGTLDRRLGVPALEWARLIGEGYRCLGCDVFRELDGDFAVALFDTNAGQLVLARDFAGARPLYWARTREGGVAFASFAISALRCANRSFIPDRQAIWREALQISLDPTPNLLCDVRLLGRNRALGFDRSGTSREQAIERPSAVSVPNHLVAQYRAEMLDSVRRRLGSADSPLMVTVSGGLDSAAVLGAARAGLGPDIPIHGVTIAPFGTAREDLPYAAEAAKRNRAVWHCRDSEQAVLPNYAIAWHPNPFAAARSGIAWEVVNAAKSLGAKTLSLGAGGDYLGGYCGSWRWWAVRELGVWRAAKLIARTGTSSPLAKARSIAGMTLRSKVPALVPKKWRFGRSEAGVGDFYTMWRIIAAEGDERRLLEQQRELALSRWKFPRSSYAEHFDLVMELSLERELSAWDALGRLAGVEMLYPLATRRTVELARHAPSALRWSEGKTRILLRRAAEPWLPPAILERRGKAVYNDHFDAVWQPHIPIEWLPIPHQWSEIFSRAAWQSARGSYCEHCHLEVFALYAGVVCATWIELNVRADSGN